MSTPDYLTEAGAILMAAAKDNRERAGLTAHLERSHPARQEIRAEALRIADGLTRLAAISAGLPPCCCHPVPPEESTP